VALIYAGPVPELPEVEIAARRLARTLAGVEVESALALGMVALKSVKPPLDAIVGMRVSGVRRVGKMPVVELGHGSDPELELLVHLMSAGRLQVFDKRASLRDRASRVLIRLADGRELRLREFGTKQRAWAKLLEAGAVEDDEMVATLGPEAWPAPPRDVLAAALDQPRHLHPLLRDQRTIAGIGRSWVDEILWEAKLSPFKKGSELDDAELGRLHAALHILGDAIDHYEQVIADTIPDKMPMPLQVHRREGEPCPRCGDTIAAIHYSERITCYCPNEQTGGKVLADRRLSRLLK
jgi:formamidopyrimidine-DNA glycosylase